MKIAFWSNSGKAGVTSCMLALSVSCAAEFGVRLSMMENHDSPTGLARFVFGARNQSGFCRRNVNGLLEDPGCFAGYNLRGACCDQFGSMRYDVLDGKLSFIWQTGLNAVPMNMDYFLRLKPLLDKSEKAGMVNFIDASVRSSSSVQILEEADAVVVVLKKDKAAVEDFFFNNPSLIHKAFFILSDYQIITPVTVKQVIQNHNVAENRIIELPYNPQYYASLQNGNAVAYLSELFSGGNKGIALNKSAHFFKKQLERLSYSLCMELGITGQHKVYMKYNGGKIDTYRNISQTQDAEKAAFYRGEYSDPCSGGWGVRNRYI